MAVKMYSTSININRNVPTQVKLLLVALCILSKCNILDLFSNGGGTGLVVVVDAFSSPVTVTTYQPRLPTTPPPTHPKHNYASDAIARQYYSYSYSYRNTKNCKTKLHEQPVNRKQILGPISPSTVAKYNLPPAVIAGGGGWSAQVVSRAATTVDNQSRRESDRVLGKVTTEVQLIPKDPQEHYAGTVLVAVPLPLDSPGLGVELLELEGGRADGLGITIVTGLVPGGNAEKAVAMSQQLTDDGETIMYGDTIASAELILQRGSETDVRSIKTECLDYESTIDALVGMLSSLLDDNSIQEASIVLSLKRLRRRPNLTVKLYYPPEQDLPPETLQLQAGDNLRMALLQKGVKLNDPLAQRYDGKSFSGNCGGGSLCRTCAVNVLRGAELLSRPKDNEKKMIDDSPRWRLACKSWVGYGMKEGEIVIQVNPRQW